MNGRIYDPLAGRFLSPDPVVQFPNNSQNFNRYSYVLNNPLSYTDPSGYFLSGLKSFFKKFWRPIFAIVLSVVTAGAFLAVYASIASGVSFGLGAGIGAIFGGGVLTTTVLGTTVAWGVSGIAMIAAGAIGGFTGGLIASGGSLKGAIYGALTGAIAAGIGNHFGATDWSRPGMEMKRALAHGISGGAIADAQGGKFSAGFFANAFSSMSTRIPGGESGWGVVRASVIGGTGSVIGDGKFENGAVTASFVHVFNSLLHNVTAKGQNSQLQTKKVTAIRINPNADGTDTTKRNSLIYLEEIELLRDQLLTEGIITHPDQLKYYVVHDEAQLAVVLGRSVGGYKIFLQHGGESGYNGTFSTNTYSGLGMKLTPSDWLEYFRNLSPGWEYQNDASRLNSAWYGCDARGGHTPADIMKSEVEPHIRDYFGGKI